MMSKEERITKERERLAATLTHLDENQKQTAAGLISSAAFLRVTLEDLEAEINEAGCTEEYTNGRDQSGIKVSAACQAYASLNTKYQSTIQKLLKITPMAPKKPKEKTAEEMAAEKEKARLEARAEQMNADFMEAVRSGAASYERYSEYCAAWEQEH